MSSVRRDDLLRLLAQFFARLHKAGFIHGDANRTNVRIDADGKIGIIDLNRMKVYPAGIVPPVCERLNDICEWSSLDDDFISFAGYYAAASEDRDITEESIVAFKRRHDRRVDTCKKIKHPVRYFFGKKIK